MGPRSSLSMLSALRVTPRAFTASQRSNPHVCYATQSYGGGEGDPKGENPLQQGPNPSSSKEHPGPPAPSTSSGAEKRSSDSGDKAAEPKIYKHAPPEPDAHDEDVKAHNEELSKRHDRPVEKSGDKEDKVDRGFWTGEFALYHHASYFSERVRGL